MRITILSLLLLFVSSIVYAGGDIAVKRVKEVSDGDSITILTNNNRTKKLRLYGIDTPEKDQPYGNASKKHLEKLLSSGKVSYSVHEVDTYGRTVADVYVNDEHINLKMIKDGYAWHYEYYKRSSEFKNAQKNAKANKLGLWKDKNPTPPWEHRKSERAMQGRNDPLIESPIDNFYMCVNLRTWKFMTTAKECPKSYIVIIGK